MFSFQNSGSIVSMITSGITITVETSYLEDKSVPHDDLFVFAYRITIENNNEFPVQLISRRWHIYDSSSQPQKVEGDGVVGVQPILSRGEKYQYISGCHLDSEIGKMEGEYVMLNIYNQKTFPVRIPEFRMVAPFKLN